MANIVKINGKYVKDITARNEITNLASQTGELTNLNTTAKNNLIAAINEVAQSDVSTLQMALAAYPTSTVSGSMVSIADGSDGLPVKSLVVDIASTAGVTGATIMRFGKNLWPDTYNPTPIDGLKRRSVFVGDNTVTLSTTMPRNTNNACNLFLLAGQVTTGENSNTNGVEVNTSRTVAAVNGYVTVSYRLVDGVDPRNYDVQLEIGDTATSFEPYQTPREFSVTFPSTAGTVCDGTLDVTNGVLTVDRVMITLDGSETWSRNENESNESGFICYTPVPISKLSANSYTSDIVSNMFTIVGNSSIANPSTTTTGIPSGGGSPLRMYFYLRYDFMADIEAWKTWLATNNVQVSYLIEPTSYQLDPIEVLTLLGENTIYTNCGDVTVTYRADPTLYSQTGAVTLDSGDISFSYGSTYPSGTVGYNLKDIGDNLVSLTQDFNQFSGDSIPLHMDGFLPSEESISDVIGELSDLDTTAKSNLVAAINEAAQSSGDGTLYIHICTNGEYNSNTGIPTIQDPDETTIYLVPDETSNDLYVEWIYANNAWEIFSSTSIDLTDYVKNTDYANSTTGGVIKLGQRTSSGLAMGSDGKLFLSRADVSEIKAATSTVLPIVPSHQHESVFYGLAKAAGDSTQAASSNSVGNYTDGAKQAIKSMLGIEDLAGEIVELKSDVNVLGTANFDFTTATDHYYISSDGTKEASANWSAIVIDDPTRFYKFDATLGSNSSTILGISFFADASLAKSSFISGVPIVTSGESITANVPTNAIVAVVCTRTASYATPNATGYYTVSKIDANCNQALDALVNLEKYTPTQSVNVTFEQGSIASDSGADTSNANRIRSAGYIDAYNFGYAGCDYNHRIWFYEYDEFKRFIKGTVETRHSFKYAELDSSTRYIRIVLCNEKTSTAIAPTDATGFYCVKDIIGTTIVNYTASSGLIEKMGAYPRPLYTVPSATTGSDYTIVGTKFVKFNDGSDDLTTDSGSITYRKYDNGFDQSPTSGEKYIYHYFGHCNSVDYNADNGCLILGNGSGNYSLPGKIFIIPDFDTILENAQNAVTTLTLQSTNAIVIDCTDYNLGSKFNVIWGEKNGTVSNIAYLITANFGKTTSSIDAGDVGVIRRLLLGMGNNQFTYGQFISGQSADAFNGTFEILDTYTQDGTAYNDCCQGTCYYKGEIVCAIGHNVPKLWRMNLADGKIRRKVYEQNIYTGDGSVSSSGATGICTDGERVYTGVVGVGVWALNL